MTSAAFIAVDWGTSNARFALCEAHGHPLEMREGPGAAQARGRLAEVFDEITAVWHEKHGQLPALMCGMVGSAFGWVEAPRIFLARRISTSSPIRRCGFVTAYT